MNLVLSLVMLGGGALAVWSGITNPPGGVVGAVGRVFRGQSAGGLAGTGSQTAPAAASLSSTAAGAYAAVVADAQTWLGVPYAWGGNTRNGVDCSGLVQNVYAEAAGVKLPRTSELQALKGQAVKPANVGGGDLVCFGVPCHHIGIALGGGELIHAPHTGTVVRVESIDSVRQSFMVPTPVYYRDVLAHAGGGR